MSIYLDSNATTEPAPQVVQAVERMMREQWANPSSVHRAGQAVRHEVELARSNVAKLIGCHERELIFTSGGTEANNLALLGLLGSALAKSGLTGSTHDSAAPLLVTSKIEHSAVRAPTEALAAGGVKVVYLPVDREGRIEAQNLANILREEGEAHRVILVSVQWANNETGVIQPVGELAKIIHDYRCGVGKSEAAKASAPSSAFSQHRSQRRVYLHVDAMQAVGKLPVNVREVQADLLTLAGHKFHGPKGIGALYVRQGVRLKPQQLGGPQERDRRGGTENTPGIVGMGIAAELALAFINDESRLKTQKALRDRLEQGVCAALPGTVVHSVNAPRLWNTTNLGFASLEAEAILLGLSERGVYASAGAACSSGSLEPSPVLLAMGIPENIAHGSVRFSLSRDTTADDIEQAIEVIPQVVGRLRAVMPTGGG